MPYYDYRCANGHEFEARHGFDAPAPPCPACGTTEVQRLITSAPGVMQGMNASLGKNASKEQLQAKWAEETPKLRDKLVSKLGEETVSKNAPSLNTKYD